MQALFSCTWWFRNCSNSPLRLLCFVFLVHIGAYFSVTLICTLALCFSARPRCLFYFHHIVSIYLHPLSFHTLLYLCVFLCIVFTCGPRLWILALLRIVLLSSAICSFFCCYIRKKRFALNWTYGNTCGPFCLLAFGAPYCPGL